MPCIYGPEKINSKLRYAMTTRWQMEQEAIQLRL